MLIPWPVVREKHWRRLSHTLSLGLLSLEGRDEMMLLALSPPSPLAAGECCGELFVYFPLGILC